MKTAISVIRKLVRLGILLVFYSQDSIQLLIRRMLAKTPGLAENRILIVKPDGIGDFILLLPFLNALTAESRLSGRKITLVLNLAVKDLAHLIDRDVADKIIWVNYSRFRKIPWYRWSWLNQFSKTADGSAFFPVSSREFRGTDAIARFCWSPHRITMKNDGVSVYLTQREIHWSDRYYTSIVSPPDEVFFEFSLLRHFFQNSGLLAGWPSQPSLIPFREEGFLYDDLAGAVVLFPGAAQRSRQWNPSNFAAVIKQLNESGLGPFVVCGSPADRWAGEEIVNLSAPALVKNVCGKTSLTALATIIGQSRLLISNETGAVHLAIALKTPVVCISNGNHLMRYSPYPPEMNTRSVYVYPPGINPSEEPARVLYNRFKTGSDQDINLIAPRDVVNAAIRLLTVGP